MAIESWFHRFVDSSPARKRPPRIGLVLSCGGARGLAHVGAIQVLEEAGIPICAVMGSSMGAYVGSLWASGVDGPGLEKLASEIKDRRTLFRLMVDLAIPPVAGFLRGEKARRHLERTVGGKQLSQLQKPLYVIATNLDDLKAEVLPQDTPVASAVQASSAIPGICTPVTLNGKRYIDGGASQPLPVSLLRKLVAADYIVAVNVMPTSEDIASEDFTSFPAKPPQPKSAVRRFLRSCLKSINLFAYGNVLDTFKRCLTAAQLRLISEESAAADVLVHPFFCESKWYDFENSHRYVQAGRDAMLAALPRIRALLSTSTHPHSHENIPVVSAVGCGIT
jgi:NTE family protein